MRSPLMRCLQTSIAGVLRLRLVLLCALLGLVACSGNSSKPERLHPYIAESRAIELQASNAIQLGNYALASRLYKRAYAAYSGIDDQAGMARQLINQAQISLLIEDLKQAHASIQALYKHIRAYQQTELTPRWTLLKANLAISQERWQDARELLEHFPASTDQAIRESAAVSRAITEWNLNKRSPSESLQGFEVELPLNQARLGRLNAKATIDRGEYQAAAEQLSTARELYRQAAFVPGIAECLIIEATLADLIAKSQHGAELRLRAGEIFKRLGNQRAIARYRL